MNQVPFYICIYRFSVSLKALYRTLTDYSTHTHNTQRSTCFTEVLDAILSHLYIV